MAAPMYYVFIAITVLPGLESSTRFVSNHYKIGTLAPWGS